MSARVWRGSICLGALILAAACKPEAQAETAVVGSPKKGPAPSADLAQTEDAIEPDPALAATASPLEGHDLGALDTPTEKSEVEQALAQAEPEPEPEPVLPEEPYKVLMIGDSLMATGIGAMLEKRLDAHPHVVAYRKGKSSSGLARPDFFDWPDEARKHIEWRKPDLLIVILGGNDGQDLTRVKGRGQRAHWNDEKWPSVYRERMDSFLAGLAGEDRKVLWLGLPPMGMRSLEKKLVLIRDVQKQAVEAMGDRGVYLDTIPLVTDDEGEMLMQAKVGPRGKTRNLRTDDKIHFTMAGSEYLADLLYPHVLEVLALPDVQPEQ